MWSTGNGRRGTRLFASALLLWIIWICAMQNGSMWYNLESAGHCPCKHPQRCRCSGGSKTPSPKEAARVVASLCPQIDVFKKIGIILRRPAHASFRSSYSWTLRSPFMSLSPHMTARYDVSCFSLSLSLPIAISTSLWFWFVIFGYIMIYLEFILFRLIAGLLAVLFAAVFLPFCPTLSNLSVYRSVYRSEHVPHKLTSWFLPPCFLRWWACKSLTATKWVLRAWQKIFSETPCKIRETKFISFLSSSHQPEESRDLSLYSFWIPVTLSYIPTQPQQSPIPLPGKHLRPYQLLVPGCELKWRRRSTRSVRKKSTLRSNQVSRTPRYTVP